jgi:DNA-binding beta-propeller fold protein YncE
VTSQESRSVVVIDGTTASVVGNVDLGTRACRVATNPRTNRVYVTGLESGVVMVVDASSHSVVDAFPTTSTVCGMAVNPQTKQVYVAAQEAGQVSVIDPGTRGVIVTRSLFGPVRATELLPNDVDVHPRSDAVYVVNKTSGTLVAATGELAPS